MNAPTLFDQDPDTGVAVPGPTERSRQVRALTLKPSAVAVLEVVRRRGEATAHDAAVDTGQQQNCSSRRLSELERLGLVRVIARQEGIRGRWLNLYRLTPDGRAAVPEVIE